jgi:hypothetical protein
MIARSKKRSSLTVFLEEGTTAELMGDGVVLIMQPDDERQILQSIALTRADLEKLLEVV